MGNSTLMMMECKSQDGERKAYGQEIDKSSFHHPVSVQSIICKGYDENLSK